MLEEGYETLRLALPALLTVTKEIGCPRLPTLRGKQRAKTAVIRVLSMRALGLGENEVGSRGSPTRVVKLRAPKLARGGTILAVAGSAGFPGVSKAAGVSGAEYVDSVESAVDRLADFIEENRFLQ
jgi:electron transfer flavoprotein alpha/beta subunit